MQVVKEPMGTKGARLTSNLSIPGRYLVLLPGSPHRGVSRKIQDNAARDRLKKIISAFEMPADVGLICRTASAVASTDELIEEAHDLWKLWCDIYERFNKAKGPTALYRESDVIKKAMMTAFDQRVDRVLIDDHQTYLECVQLAKKYQKEGNAEVKVEYYKEDDTLFERFGVEKEIEKALRRKVWMPSGSYLFFDKTEAMLTIDVNSGRSGSQATEDVEEALVNINLEAADEIARQLRLRNAGGLIVCDFIDMRSRKNQRRVLDRLKEAMKDDSAKCTVLGMSEFGLVEMTRQRQRESLAETLMAPCPYCQGLGQIKNHQTILFELERELRRIAHAKDETDLEVVVHPEMYRYLQQGLVGDVIDGARQVGLAVRFNSQDNYHLNQFEVFARSNGKKITA